MIDLPEVYLKRALVAVAKSWVGVRERGGNNKGESVERFQRSLDGIAEGEPWCMSFVQFCVKESRALAEEVFAQTFNISNKIYSTEHCLTCWNKTDKFQRLYSPVPGALIFWQKYHLDLPTMSGHVGIVTRVCDENTIMTVEGNTNDNHGIVRDGDGVYELTRHWKLRQGDLRFLGFLNPW